MGFNFKGAGFNFAQKAKQMQKNKEPETDYQQRNKQEQDRRKIATCSNYFTTVCFKAEAELRTFQKLLGSQSEFYACCNIESIVANFPTAKRDWKTRVTTSTAKISLWNEKETFEQTCKNDLQEFMKLANQVDKTKDCKNVYNSPFYFVLVAKDDGDMQNFLTKHKLFRYGDRYLNGSKWLNDIQAV